MGHRFMDLGSLMLLLGIFLSLKCLTVDSVGVYQYFPVNYEDVEMVIADKRIRGCSLTGSGASGRIVGAFCGAHIKKCVLELGGADPFIVLDDANLEKAAKAGVTSRLINNSQACTNAKRFIVNENVYDDFKQKVIDELTQIKIGDPREDDTNLGPLAKEEAVHNLRKQVLASIEKGAKVVYGDESQLNTELDTSKGFFFTPMILEDIPKDSPAYNEELFGPVIGMFKVKNDDEALELANDHEYGLSGCVFGTNLERAEKVALEIESGMVNINDFSKGHKELPFGGVTSSGYGREGGIDGCRQFINIKAVSIMNS
jgi:succinate-semialdehyde dehydrogenase/glutarate-semialdehyde dehydrogenase